ncbi:siderophore-interacting protein [Nocardioides alcanivorans]|uniref:siderophore-interacting protein n=1 Tax=Nocardioides alcanivorans TaxID=2897352 RepID=UPI001F43CB49|nr:siderophore-interacting protein [Nocardioides alcanivorans]
MSTPSSGAGRPQRPPRPVIELTVQSTEQLSPHLVRLVAGGPGFSAFVDNGKTDKYVKIRFPEHDVTRTYTVRHVDGVARTITLDFVVHGDEGIAGPWAANAKPGDPITFVGPGGAFVPDPTADVHLFAGDASALPAIGAALEALPADARGVAHLVVEDESEVLELAAPVGVELRWHFHSPAGSNPDVLAEAIAAAPWPQGRVQVFAHGERESMKAIRAVLKERDVAREDLSLSGYWAHGRTEDRFQAEKKEPIGQIPD